MGSPRSSTSLMRPTVATIIIRVLTEEPDVFVLLVCWVYREEMESKMQMERWDMTMLGHSVAWHALPQQL